MLTRRSQVYGGITAEATSTNHAVGSTAGRVLYWNGGSRPRTTTRPRVGRQSPSRRYRRRRRPCRISSPWPIHTTTSPSSTGGRRPARTPAAVGRKLGVGVVRDLLVCRGPSRRVTEVTIKSRTGAGRWLRRGVPRCPGSPLDLVRGAGTRPGTAPRPFARRGRALRRLARASCAGSARYGSNSR